MSSIIRGTTPTFTMRIPNANLLDAESVYVTVKQVNTTITKTGSDVEVQSIVGDNDEVTGSMVMCWLTERESLKLQEGVDALIQVNWTYLHNGRNVKRAATKSKIIEIDKQLLNGAITT